MIIDSAKTIMHRPESTAMDLRAEGKKEFLQIILFYNGMFVFVVVHRRKCNLLQWVYVHFLNNAGFQQCILLISA